MRTSIYRGALIALAWAFLQTIAQAGALVIERDHGVGPVQVQEKNGQLKVFGSVNRGVASHRVPGAHIHILLLNRQGEIIGCRVESVSAVTPRRDAILNYRAAYSVRFSAPELARAAKVWVRYRANPHGECSGDDAEACATC